MANRLGYHHVALRARDLHKTIAFYEALGCSVVRSWGEGEKEVCMLDVGGNNIIEIFAGGGSEDESFPHFEHIALRSEDVDGDFQAALAAGAREKNAPNDVNDFTTPSTTSPILTVEKNFSLFSLILLSR